MPFPRTRPGWVAVSFFALVVAVGATAHALPLEARWPEFGPRFAADLARAYAPCTAPNDVAGSIPACAPPVSSACTFERGDVILRPSNGGVELVEANIRGAAGSGACPTGPYSLELVLRMTIDDENCTSGTCTVEDQTLSLPMVPAIIDGHFRIDAALDDFLPGEPVRTNYEVLRATVIGPDALPLAGAGVDNDNANSYLASLSIAYPQCTVPDTASVYGGACDAPVWATTCDFESGFFRLRGGDPLRKVFDVGLNDAVGTSPECVSGTYGFEATMRITGPHCTGGAACTLVDTPVTASLTAGKGDIDDFVPFAEALPVVPTDAEIQVLAVRVLDPLGAALASNGTANIARIGTPKMVLNKKDLTEPMDDIVKIQGTIPTFVIDPTEAPGVIVTITDRNGVAYTVTLPGPSWQLGEPIGTRWDYEDPFGGQGGVRKAQIKQYKQAGDVAGYKVKIFAKGTDVSAMDFPSAYLKLEIALAGGFQTAVAHRNRTCKVGSKTFVCK